MEIFLFIILVIFAYYLITVFLHGLNIFDTLKLIAIIFLNLSPVILLFFGIIYSSGDIVIHNKTDAKITAKIEFFKDSKLFEEKNLDILPQKSVTISVPSTRIIVADDAKHLKVKTIFFDDKKEIVYENSEDYFYSFHVDEKIDILKLDN